MDHDAEDQRRVGRDAGSLPVAAVALDRAGNAAFAETFLMAFLAVQQLAVIVLTPLYAAGSIADEKERGTLDFLLSSPLPHYQILLGKLLARLAFVGSILAVGWPVLMLTFLFGGVDFEHLLAGFAISAVTAIFLANWGILLACAKKNFRETLPGIAAVLLLPATTFANSVLSFGTDPLAAPIGTMQFELGKRYQKNCQGYYIGRNGVR